MAINLSQRPVSFFNFNKQGEKGERWWEENKMGGRGRNLGDGLWLSF